MTPKAHNHDQRLSRATEELISENGWPAGKVIAAVAHAKVRARDLYAECGIDLPAPDDYVALIIASARHRLTHHK